MLGSEHKRPAASITSSSSSFVARKIDFDAESSSSSSDDNHPASDPLPKASPLSTRDAFGAAATALFLSSSEKKVRLPRRLSLEMRRQNSGKSAASSSPKTSSAGAYLPKRLDFNNAAASEDASASSSGSESEKRPEPLLLLNNNSPRNSASGTTSASTAASATPFRRPNDISTPLRSQGEVPKMEFGARGRLFKEGSDSREDKISPINASSFKQRLAEPGCPKPVLDSRIISAANKRRQSAPGATTTSHLALRTPMPTARPRSRIAMLNHTATASTSASTPDNKHSSSSAADKSHPHDESGDSVSGGGARKKVSRVANVNPYTPTVLLETSIRKRSRSMMSLSAASTSSSASAIRPDDSNGDGR